MDDAEAKRQLDDAKCRLACIRSDGSTVVPEGMCIEILMGGNWIQASDTPQWLRSVVFRLVPHTPKRQPCTQEDFPPGSAIRGPDFEPWSYIPVVPTRAGVMELARTEREWSFKDLMEMGWQMTNPSLDGLWVDCWYEGGKS